MNKKRLGKSDITQKAIGRTVGQLIAVARTLETDKQPAQPMGVAEADIPQVPAEHFWRDKCKEFGRNNARLMKENAHLRNELIEMKRRRLANFSLADIAKELEKREMLDLTAKK